MRKVSLDTPLECQDILNCKKCPLTPPWNVSQRRSFGLALVHELQVDCMLEWHPGDGRVSGRWGCGKPGEGLHLCAQLFMAVVACRRYVGTLV